MSFNCSTHNLPVCVSTGIDEEMTCGHGELDDYGFWEIHCQEGLEEMKRRLNEPIEGDNDSF